MLIAIPFFHPLKCRPSKENILRNCKITDKTVIYGCVDVTILTEFNFCVNRYYFCIALLYMQEHFQKYNCNIKFSS